MPGCSFSKSVEIHNRDWLVTPLLSAISGKSATVRVQLDKHSKYTPIDQFIEGYLAKKPFMFSYNPTHQVVVCHICHSSSMPTRWSVAKNWTGLSLMKASLRSRRVIIGRVCHS
jgi:hypothetical protein